MYNTDNLNVEKKKSKLHHSFSNLKSYKKNIKTYLNTDPKVDTIKTFGNFPFRNFR